jgi:hypothetical protein
MLVPARSDLTFILTALDPDCLEARGMYEMVARRAMSE